MSELHWRPMRPGDVDGVVRVAAVAFPDHFEARACFAERLALFPNGCFVLASPVEVKGYLIAYPWPFGAIPPLNSLLGRVGLIGPIGPDAPNLLRTAIVLGLSAGLCEGLMRLVAFWWRVATGRVASKARRRAVRRRHHTEAGARERPFGERSQLRLVLHHEHRRARAAPQLIGRVRRLRLPHACRFPVGEQARLAARLARAQKLWQKAKSLPSSTSTARFMCLTGSVRTLEGRWAKERCATTSLPVPGTDGNSTSAPDNIA